MPSGDIPMQRAPKEGENAYAYTCENGCVHLVWHLLTLHFCGDEWTTFVRIVTAAEQQLRGAEAPRQLQTT